MCMKKIKIIFVSLITFFSFSLLVNAASGTLSVSSDNVKEGDTFNTTVTINSAAAWNVHVSADGPVKDCTIDEVGVTDDATDTDKAFTTTCTTTGGGKVVLKLEGDVTSVTDDTAVDISSTKIVNVIAKKSNSFISNPLTWSPILNIFFIVVITSTIILLRKNISNKN